MSLVPRVQRLKSIGKSLEKYLKKAHDHELMMERERAEFERGKRHLANIMGWDVNQPVKQEDIDSAIGYLFPSSLSDPFALPVMKPPDEILPRFSKFEFDSEGRPADHLFYTLRPRFYNVLSECGLKAQRLVSYHDERTLQKKESTEPSNLMLTGSDWLSQKDLSKKLGERVKDELYGQLIIAFENLCKMPNAHFERDFISEYRTLDGEGKRISELFHAEIPEVQIDTETNKRFTVVTSKVKTNSIIVKVTDAGTGKYLFNGHHYSVFRSIIERECLVAPLILTDKFGQVDIEATSESGFDGQTTTPRAIRHGVSLGLAALYPEFKQRLRFAGYLTTDPRRRERSKISQPGARAKWIWKKR